MLCLSANQRQAMQWSEPHLAYQLVLAIFRQTDLRQPNRRHATHRPPLDAQQQPIRNSDAIVRTPADKPSAAQPMARWERAANVSSPVPPRPRAPEQGDQLKANGGSWLSGLGGLFGSSSNSLSAAPSTAPTSAPAATSSPSPASMRPPSPILAAPGVKDEQPAGAGGGAKGLWARAAAAHKPADKPNLGIAWQMALSE